MASTMDKYVRIVSDSITRRMKVINPATGEALPGVCEVTIKTKDDAGNFLPVPIAEVKMYARVDVVAALEVVPVEWPGKDKADVLKEMTNSRKDAP